jgi:hypothetical protein
MIPFLTHVNLGIFWGFIFKGLNLDLSHVNNLTGVEDLRFKVQLTFVRLGNVGDGFSVKVPIKLLVPCVTMSHLKTFLGFKVCVW